MTSTGLMAMGGIAKTAMLNPRINRSSAGARTKPIDAAMATALPTKKPIEAGKTVAQICGG